MFQFRIVLNLVGKMSAWVSLSGKAKAYINCSLKLRRIHPPHALSAFDAGKIDDVLELMQKSSSSISNLRRHFVPVIDYVGGANG